MSRNRDLTGAAGPALLQRETVASTQRNPKITPLTRIGCEPVATGAADQENYALPYLCCQLNFPLDISTT